MQAGLLGVWILFCLGVGVPVQEKKATTADLFKLLAEARAGIDALAQKKDFHALTGLEAEWAAKIEAFLTKNPGINRPPQTYLLLIRLYGGATDRGARIKALYERIKAQQAMKPWFVEFLRSAYYHLHHIGQEELLHILSDAESVSTLAEVRAASLFFRGEVFMKNEKKEEAAELFTRIEQEFPNDPFKTQATWNLHELSHLQVGMPAPEIKIKNVRGGEIQLSSLKGKVVLLFFFTYWAPLLPNHVPLLNKLNEQFKDGPFALVGVSLDEPGDAPALKKALTSHNITWPVGFDGLGWKGPEAYKYNIKAVPRGFLIDAQGNILMKDLFYRPDLKQRVGQAVTQLQAAIQKAEAERKRKEEEKKKAEEAKKGSEAKKKAAEPPSEKK
jgi:peroxiredoxin